MVYITYVRQLCFLFRFFSITWKYCFLLLLVGEEEYLPFLFHRGNHIQWRITWFLIG